MDKIVVHGNDGVLLKGHSADFSPHLPYFHLATLQNPADSVKILLDNQKAVFFVKSFTGNATRSELKDWNRAPRSGRHIIVTFNDGEILYGTAETVDSDHKGFFLYPADPNSNNIRVYVINRFISGVELSMQ